MLEIKSRHLTWGGPMCRLKYKKAAAFSEKSDQQTADNQDQDGLEWKKSVWKSEKNLHSIKLL